MRKITEEMIKEFTLYLINEEKSQATVEKYERDVRGFYNWTGGEIFEKGDVLCYKAHIKERYAPSSVNSMLSSLNCFFSHFEWYEMRVKSLKVQRQIFSRPEKELSKEEYLRLLEAARDVGDRRLYLVMQTICSTGIRVSELCCVTVEAVAVECARVCCKGKRRDVFLPRELCRMLKIYIKEQKIKSGAVFVTKNGKPLDRSDIWKKMKGVCAKAGVRADKVFPHNLRHLFARTYYALKKDIVRLADILGHSDVNTTRIYTAESGEIHRKNIQSLGLLKLTT